MNYLKKWGYGLLVAIVTCICTNASAQGHHDGHHKHSHGHGKHYYKKNEGHSKKGRQVYYKHTRGHVYHTAGPYWASVHRYRGQHHVYFRDYCTFYDPYRGGYVYWHHSRWIFTRTIPSFLAHVDLNTARIQVMADIPLSRHPEYDYERYATSYPRNARIHVGIDLPL